MCSLLSLGARQDSRQDRGLGIKAPLFRGAGDRVQFRKSGEPAGGMKASGAPMPTSAMIDSQNLRARFDDRRGQMLEGTERVLHDGGPSLVEFTISQLPEVYEAVWATGLDRRTWVRAAPLAPHGSSLTSMVMFITMYSIVFTLPASMDPPMSGPGGRPLWRSEDLRRVARDPRTIQVRSVALDRWRETLGELRARDLHAAPSISPRPAGKRIRRFGLHSDGTTNPVALAEEDPWLQL